MFQKTLFRDRHDAGLQLAQSVMAALTQIDFGQIVSRPIVYALPRGGLPVAEPLAQLLHCPLSVIVAKKVTRPDNPELAIGAVTSDGEVLRSRYDESRDEPWDLWHTAVQQAQEKAQEQFAQLSLKCPGVDPEGALALLVDDGIATGMTMAVAARALRALKPAQLWICAPVAPSSMVPVLEEWCDRLVLLQAPSSFSSVSRFYREFPQVETAEALACLERQNREFGVAV